MVSFRKLLDDRSFDWRSIAMEGIDPFLVSTLRFVDVLRATQCSYASPVYMEIRYRVSLHEFECYERQ